MSQGSAATVELVVVNGGPDDIEALTETLRAGGVPVGVAGTDKVVAVPVWVAGTDTVVPGVPDNAGTRTLTAAINTWRQRRQSEAGLEVVAVHDSISVRNTGDPESPVLYFSRSEWAAFVAGVKSGEFDDHVSPGTGSSQPSAGASSLAISAILPPHSD